MIRSKTTSNVRKAQERKERLRAERRVAREEKAARLGISVLELENREFEKVEQIRREYQPIPDWGYRYRRERYY